jgi:5-methylcytosine-specific restriction endonuclease McrA
MKTCTKCGETKPVSDFYKRARSNDGYMSWCKACAQVHDNARNTAPERKAARANSKRARYAPVKAANQVKQASVRAELTAATIKTCKKCRQEKSIESFTVDTRYKDGRYPWCFECRQNWRKGRMDKQRELHANWREKNREHTRTYGREYYQNNDESRERNRAAGRVRDRDRWHNDPEYRAKKNKWKVVRYQTDPVFRKKRRSLALVGVHRRRARIRLLAAHFTAAEWRAVCDKYGNRCLSCGKVGNLTPDHVIPISRGGSNEITNIQPLCLACNMHKSAKTIDYRPLD